MSERTEQTAPIQPRRKARKVQSEAIAKHWLFLTAWYDAKRTEQTARRLDAAARATRIIDCSLAGNDVTAALDDANQQAETFEDKQRRYAEKH